MKDPACQCGHDFDAHDNFGPCGAVILPCAACPCQRFMPGPSFGGAVTLTDDARRVLEQMRFWHESRDFFRAIPERN